MKTLDETLKYVDSFTTYESRIFTSSSIGYPNAFCSEDDSSEILTRKYCISFTFPIQSNRQNHDLKIQW